MSKDILHQPFDDPSENPDDEELTAPFEMAEPPVGQPVETRDEGEPKAQVEAEPAPTGEAPVEEPAPIEEALPARRQGDKGTRGRRGAVSPRKGPTRGSPGQDAVVEARLCPPAQGEGERGRGGTGR